jgi:phosphatidylglycerol---prolipoprotein diacylglyceryl transferase
VSEPWVHNLSPFLWQFSPGAGLRWYGISYVLGFVVAYGLLVRLAKQARSPLPAHKVADAMLMLVVGVIAGGRLGYVILYDHTALWTFTKSLPFWELLNLARGGMAYHGALVGVFVSSLLVHRKHCGKGTPWSALADVLALACTIGLGLGRLANFVNGELLGKIVAQPGQAGPWWSVKFPQELQSGHAPTLSEAQGVALEGVLLKHTMPSDAGDLGFAADRMIATIQRGGAAGEQAAKEIGPLLASRFPSQLLQALFEGVVLTAVLWGLWRVLWRRAGASGAGVVRVGPKPGIIAAVFVLMYGVLRIVAEFYRLPDAQLGAFALGLSRGQWLSAAMVAVGGVWLVRAWTKK